MSSYRICRDDGISDGIAGQVFDSYDAAYAVVERYCVFVAMDTEAASHCAKSAKNRPDNAEMQLFQAF